MELRVYQRDVRTNYRLHNVRRSKAERGPERDGERDGVLYADGGKREKALSDHQRRAHAEIKMVEYDGCGYLW